MPTHYEYAVMSREVYNKDGGTPPDGWTVRKPYYPKNYWGLGVAIYQKGRIASEYVIAFRGTHSLLKNAAADIGLFFGQIPPGTFDDKMIADHRREAGHLRTILEGILIYIKTFGSGANVSYTGHSLGGCMAEIRACHENKKAVTFDSPGCEALLERPQIEWGNGNSRCYLSPWRVEPNITSYLSAPNPINTLHKHVGTKIRLHVDHRNTQGIADKTHKLLYAASNIGDDALRISFWFKVIPHIIPQLPEIFDGINFNTFILIFFLVLALRFIRDLTWVQTQHTINNLVECFDPHTGQVKPSNDRIPGNGKVMASWPTYREHHVLGRSQRILFFPIPALPSNSSKMLPDVPLVGKILNITSSNRGILNLLCQEDTTENQNKNTPGYKYRK